MANNAQNALVLLQNVLSKPQDSEDQAVALAELRNALEEQTGAIPILYTTLISMLGGSSRQMKHWIVSLMEFAICRNPATMESRTQLVLQSLDHILKLLSDPELSIQKRAIQCFTTAYPLLFRHACGTTSDAKLWEKVVSGKRQVLELWKSDAVALKLAGMKLVQKIIQTQSKAAPDPRLHKTDPNLGHCPSHHPFLRVNALEEEAKQLLVECVTLLFNSKSPDILTSLVNALIVLVKSRPSNAELVIQSLTNWTPDALASLSALQIKSVEKSIRIGLAHLLRTGHAGAHATTINTFLARQTTRMDVAASEARAAREAEASRKRQIITDELSSNKRRKISKDKREAGPPKSLYEVLTGPDYAGNPLAEFDASTLPSNLVVDLVMATFQSLADERLQQAILPIRQELDGFTEYEVQDDSKVNPLNLGADDDEEMEFKTEQAAIPSTAPPDETEDPLPSRSGLFARPFKIQMPKKQNPSTKSDISKLAISQISQELKPFAGDSDYGAEFWVFLVSRLAARVPQARPDKGQDVLRQTLFDFVLADIGTRMELARLWLNEEWYTAEVTLGVLGETSKDCYFYWLTELLDQIREKSSNQDKEFMRFLSDLPEIPNEQIKRLVDMCTNCDQMQLGFTALRDLCMLRPNVRPTALDALFSLAVHSDKATRNPAILTLKRWVPDTAPLNGKVVQFALSLLHRLETPPEDTLDAEAMDMAVDEQDTLMGHNLLVSGGEIARDFPYPKNELGLVRHVELLLALSSKCPELLRHIFTSYPKMSPFCKNALLSLITGLVRSLGPKHPQIHNLIRDCPLGSEDLALKILAILTEKGRPSPALVNLIREMSLEKELDPRFLVPIISEFDMRETTRQLPRIVSLLDGTPEKKAIVRSVFESIVSAQTQTFGSASTNIPRVRQNDHLTPKELLMLLHTNEKEIGLKSTMEAIALCFSMTETFKTEVWAAFMQQVLDEPTPLPTLFLRTVIQAVQYYRQLQPFVSTTLLSRLITKKIWTTPQLWEGFIRCTSAIAPHSFGALLQLPKEQLKEVVMKQENLRKPLREYVVKKAGNNQARVSSLLELLADENAMEP
ncbi:hypothetical protein BT69DRAFT_1256010 [Atractiella rhizophila]|nr:hypothetical protein BT69DRAFT_1256010 [Atractiella rhizophila]